MDPSIVATYYDNLFVEELKDTLPALCRCIVSRVTEDPHPGWVSYTYSVRARTSGACCREPRGCPSRPFTFSVSYAYMTFLFSNDVAGEAMEYMTNDEQANAILDWRRDNINDLSTLDIMFEREQEMHEALARTVGPVALTSFFRYIRLVLRRA